MRFYTASRLGSKRSYSKEGYLVCLDVPIARTGEMYYAGTELPEMEPGQDGLIRVLRDAEQVFDPEALASFVGKPTTNGHPPDMVGPENYRKYASGSAQNIRRGNGAEDDLVFADLIFTEPGTIKDIEDGKDEISLGYDAEYEPVSPGVYRQYAITGNHVAVVENGRCGPRCAIGDSAAALQSTKAAETAMEHVSAPPCGCQDHHHRDAKPARAKKRTHDMTKKVLKASVLDRLRRSFAAKDEAGFEEGMTAVEEAAEASEEQAAQAQFAQMVGTAVAEAIAPITARLDDVDAYITDRKMKDSEVEEAKKKAETADKAAKDAKAKKARDSAPPDMGTGSLEGTLTNANAGGGPDSSQPSTGSGFNLGGDAGETQDSADLAAFLASKGLSDADVAACLAMLKKDEPEATPTADDGLTEEEKKAKEKEEADKKVGTTDSAGLLAAFRDTIAKAEILAPGVKVPTFDAKASGKATNDAMCALRRRALRSAFDHADRKNHVAPFLDSATPDFSKMTCDAVKLVFGGASELAKRGNAASLTPIKQMAPTRDAATRDTIADIQAKANELWGKTAR